MGLIFLVGFLVLIAQMPSIYRSTPDKVIVYDPETHARWKKLYLRAHYAFLIGIALFGLGVTGLTLTETPTALNALGPAQIAAYVGIFAAIPVLLWAVFLNRKALELKEILWPPGYLRVYPVPIPREKAREHTEAES